MIILQQKLFSRLLTRKYNLPSLCYSSLRPPSVKDKPNDSFPYTGPRSAPIKVKPKRDPFLKNILVGKIDGELLVYPEVLDLERLKNIDQMSEVLNRYWIEEVSPDPKYFSKGSSKDFLNRMSNFGLSKQKVPYSYNGLELTATESVKIVETLGRNPFPVNYLSSQNIVQEILSMTTEQIKDKYYDGIVQNNWTGTVCLSEIQAEFDIQKCNTKVTWSDSIKGNVLNGQKIWVANADIADFFVVLGHFNGPSVFFVDRNKPGITINEHKETGYFIVEFKDTPLGDNDIVTTGSKGLEIFSKIQSLSKLYFSSAVVGILKDVFDCTTQYLMYRPFLQKYCSDFESTQIIIAKAASEIYALEAMLYLTTSLIDGYDGQDCEVELAVLKLFASQVSQNVITDCINVLGPHVTMHSYQYPFLETLCTVKRLSHLNVSDDLMKLFVAIKCIDHNKPNLMEYLEKVKSPILHLHESIKHNMYISNHEKELVTLDLHVHHNVHPSLKSCADSLEYCVKRLEYVNILLLERFGIETYDHQYSLLLLTNIICEIYGMTSALSRASRSYCTGIQNSDMELISANIFCQTAHKKVKNIVSEIESWEYNVGFEAAKILSEKILNLKGYFAQHPLARNLN